MSKTIEAITYFKYALIKLADKAVLKIMYSSIFAIFANIFAGLNHEGVTICYMLMIGDFITGIVASHKEGHRIRSSKLIRTVEKMALYGILIITGYFVDKVVGMSLGQPATIIFVAVTEATSIMENIARAGLPVPRKLLTKFIDIKNKK